MKTGRQWRLTLRLHIHCLLCALLIATLISAAYCSEPNSWGSRRKRKKPAPVYAWMKDPDIIRLQKKHGIHFWGDRSGPYRLLRLSPSDTPDNLVDDDLKCLAKWPTFKTVHLDGEKISGASLEYLQPSTKLDLLSFAALDSRGFQGKDVEHLVGKKELQVLRLLGMKITPDAMKQVGRLESPKDLSFAHNLCSPVTDEDLAHLSGLKHLESLGLSNSKVTGSGLKYLIPIKTLQDVHLSDTAVRERDVRELARSLPKLRIWCEGFILERVSDAVNAPQFAEAYRTEPELLALSKHNARICSGGGELDIYVDDDELTDEDLASLAKLSVREVFLWGKRLTPAVLHHLRSSDNLTRVSLHLTDRGFEAQDIEPLEGKTGLRYLCLEGNSITQKAMEKIGQLKSLWYLDLSGCPVTNDDLAYLADNYYSRLSLDGTKVTSAGLQHILPKEKTDRLRSRMFLGLSNTAVKKSDIEPLHELMPNVWFFGGDWEVRPRETEYEWFKRQTSRKKKADDMLEQITDDANQ